MAEDKMDYQVVTMRIPKKMYQEYKKILKEEGKVVTYEVRNFMRDYIEEYSRKESEQKK
ncbi:transcriptional regulator (plasmid) [Enterococcus faecium]